MQRHELEHIIRAASAIANTREIVIVGSQAILGPVPDAPAELLRSQEADCFPLPDASKADLIDGAIGELSPFHDQYGYYAHGVSPETAVLPSGWRERLVPVCNENTGGCTGWCLSLPDLAAGKLAAGREKDLAFLAAMLRHALIASATIESFLSLLPDSHRRQATERLARIRAG